MLVLYRIYAKGLDSSHVNYYSNYRLDIKCVEKYCSSQKYLFLKSSLVELESIRFDILDTETGGIEEGNSIKDIYGRIDTLFGVVTSNTSYDFVSITKDIWNFLDIVNEPIRIAKTINDIKEDGDNIETYFEFWKIHNDNKVKYVFREDLMIWDDNGAFWLDILNSDILSILDVYKRLFNQVEENDLNKEIEFYIQRYYKSLIKLDMSKEVIRFLLKLKVLEAK